MDHPASGAVEVRTWAIAALLLLASLPSAASPIAPKRHTLPNGLRVIVKSNWSTEVVAIEMLLDVSAQDEPAGQEGVRYLVQRLLLRGTTSETGAAMGRRLAAVGGVVNTTVGLDYVEIYALVPADGFEVALELIADAVRHPAFSPEEVEKQKSAALEVAAAARGKPFQETYLALRERLYRDHPYGNLTFGAPESLADVSRADILSCHRTHYGPSRAVVAICGGVGEVRAMRAARHAFEDWHSVPPRRRAFPPPPKLRVSEVTAREGYFTRAHAIMGFPAPAVDGPGYYVMQVIDTILGGGATARLPRMLREELGLVYTVSSFYPTLAHDSHFGVYVVTGPARLRDVKSAVLNVLHDLTREPISEEELTRAKTYLLGSYDLSHQRMKEQAYSLAWYEILGVGVEFEETYRDEIRAVTAGEVLETARALFGRFVLAVTLPRE